MKPDDMNDACCRSSIYMPVSYTFSSELKESFGKFIVFILFLRFSTTRIQKPASLRELMLSSHALTGRARTTILSSRNFTMAATDRNAVGRSPRRSRMSRQTGATKPNSTSPLRTGREATCLHLAHRLRHDHGVSSIIRGLENGRDGAIGYTMRGSRTQWETSPRCMNSRNAAAALFNSTLAAQAIPTSMVGTLSASDVASTRRPSSDHGR